MKILNTLITLGCLGGLVSCYPIATQAPTKATATKALEKKAVAKKTATTAAVKKKAASSVNTVKKKVTPTIPSTPSVSDITSSTTDVVEKKVAVTKPVIPTGVKTATKVPGKEGFVFNPFTHNQVDVRGIPAGTKVRDPHDANPAHIFRVPQ